MLTEVLSEWWIVDDFNFFLYTFMPFQNFIIAEKIFFFSYICGMWKFLRLGQCWVLNPLSHQGTPLRISDCRKSAFFSFINDSYFFPLQLVYSVLSIFYWKISFLIPHAKFRNIPQWNKITKRWQNLGYSLLISRPIPSYFTGELFSRAYLRHCSHLC